MATKLDKLIRLEKTGKDGGNEKRDARQRARKHRKLIDAQNKKIGSKFVL